MIISISPLGNLGNRMIEYAVVKTLGRLIGCDVTYNCKLPEWGISFEQSLHDLLMQDEKENLIVRDRDFVSIYHILDLYNKNNKLNIVFDGFFQRINLLFDPVFYKNDVFPHTPISEDCFDDSELVINVRAGEILDGKAWWYPLVPVAFYEYLVKSTGLKPVFIGQLDDCSYIREIKKVFPESKMIPSSGPMIDLNRIRSAKNICISVSTFSWIAAWLSSAKQIYYPLLGFLHPGSFRYGTHGLGGIDLAPVDDIRYRFFLFPVIKAEPEIQYLKHVEGISPIVKEIPKEHVSKIKNLSTYMAAPCTSEIVDEDWYIKRYITAAWEISEGWYHDATHHYNVIGKARGYLAIKPLYNPKSKNISLNKTAVQSSISEWSLGLTVEQDACRALDGNYDKDIAFHTNLERHPWWCVDLSGVYSIESVDIYNRKSISSVRRRVNPFVLEFSLDSHHWDEVARTNENFDFGCEVGVNRPFQWIGNFSVHARFIRIRVLKDWEALHLAMVDVFGTIYNDGEN